MSSWNCTCRLDAYLAAEAGASTLAELGPRVRRLQQEKLERLLVRVQSLSSFYAQRLAGLDLRPISKAFSSQKPLSLAPLPFMDEKDLVPMEPLLCVPLGEIERIVSTSGTTGPKKRIAATAYDLTRSRDFFRIGMSDLVGRGEKLLVLLPYGTHPGGVLDLLKGALEGEGVQVISGAHLDQARLSAQVREIAPEALIALPAQLEQLLQSLPKAWPGLRAVLSSGEVLPQGLQRALISAWGCEVRDHYGLTETGFGLAVECAKHTGLHLRALDVLVEVIDPVGLENLPYGESGELVITTLSREAMPLIRYRTGDRCALLPSPCACKSPLPRLARPEGRLYFSHIPKGGYACRTQGKIL